MNKIRTSADKLYQFASIMIPGAFIFGVFQFPLKVPIAIPVTATVTAGEIVSEREALELAEAFFGLDADAKETRKAIDKQITFVSSRKAYSASLSVVQKHEATIKREAAQKNVPEDVALGVALLENGGSDTAVSSAGALGVFQLMPGTARSLGLTVNKKSDERRNPSANIEAGVRYLRSNFDRFGDWGLATWAYHAGEGNVSKALKIYAKANHNVNLAGVKKPGEIRAFVEKYGITIHKLLSDPSVKQFTRKLNDDSSGYPYKVIATATLFKEAK